LYQSVLILDKAIPFCPEHIARIKEKTTDPTAFHKNVSVEMCHLPLYFVWIINLIKDWIVPFFSKTIIGLLGASLLCIICLGRALAAALCQYAFVLKKSCTQVTVNTYFRYFLLSQ